MADLALTRKANGKYDFLRVGSDLQRTNAPDPAILRLLMQGTWLGDDGERAGKSLSDLRITTSQTRSELQRIVESRLGVLLTSGKLDRVEVLRVETYGGRAFVLVSVVEPGQQPRTLQVPITA